MARKAARLLVSIWDDKDFTALPSVQQVVYLSILSSRDLSWCGVNPLLPQRFSGVSADMTERKAAAALDALAAARFLIIDRSTAEVAVRTFVRHDEVLRSPNVSKAMGRALGDVRSNGIRKAVKAELKRLWIEDSAANGWGAIRAAYPELFTEVTGNPSENPSENPSVKVA